MRQSRPMTTRRDSDRPSHVRRRPPSSGRPAPGKIKLKPTTPARVAVRRRVEPRSSLPLPAQILLAAAVVSLGVVTLVGATGGLGRLVSAFGTSLSGILTSVVTSPSPTPAPVAVSRSPLIASPDEPYTNQKRVDLSVSVPTSVAGQSDVRVRVYLALEGQAAAPITEVAVGLTPKVVVPVDLSTGRNDFTASVIGPGGESEPSPVVTYILDTEAPKITISSPKDGAVVNAATVDLVGKVQARSRLLARNDSNGSSITGTSGADGSFTLTLPLATGSNAIKIGATDPAGNGGELGVTVVRGTGALSVALTASTYRISVASLPAAMELVAVVTDPDGRPLRGAVVVFSLTLPKIPAITYEAHTGADGKVTFSTTIPKGVDIGSGLVSVLVNTNSYGQTTDRSVITVVK
jgi:hypothetical protein